MQTKLTLLRLSGRKSHPVRRGAVFRITFFKYLLWVRALWSAQVKKPSLLQERDNSCVLCYKKRNLMEWVMVFSTETKPWPGFDRIHLLLTQTPVNSLVIPGLGGGHKHLSPICVWMMLQRMKCQGAWGCSSVVSAWLGYVKPWVQSSVPQKFKNINKS